MNFFQLFFSKLLFFFSNTKQHCPTTHTHALLCYGEYIVEKKGRLGRRRERGERESWRESSSLIFLPVCAKRAALARPWNGVGLRVWICRCAALSCLFEILLGLYKVQRTSLGRSLPRESWCWRPRIARLAHARTAIYNILILIRDARK